MNDAAIQLFRMLIEAGAVPGEDFSSDASQQSYRINERGFILLQNAFPEIDWHDIAHMAEFDVQQPVQALHEALGINFVDNIIHCIEQRLAGMDDPEAAWYVHQVLNGVEQRTQVPLYQLLQQQLSAFQQAHLERLLAYDGEPVLCDAWISDLVLSAGGSSQDFEADESGVLLTEQGMYLLSQVWQGEVNIEDYDWPQSA
jgi:hypothetical protein